MAFFQSRGSSQLPRCQHCRERRRSRRAWVGVVASVVTGLMATATSAGCSKSSARSLTAARASASELVPLTATDTGEVTRGLPVGAKRLVPLYEEGDKALEDSAKLRSALDEARSKVQDLRVAKSTFFTLTDARGVALRSDQEVEQLAGKALLPAFPELARVFKGELVVTRGSHEAVAGLKGRVDAQWLAAAPIGVGGAVKGAYVTGWSWSSYAYYLENQARSAARRATEQAGPPAKLPLVYVFMVVGGEVYGAPAAPDVSIAAIRDRRPLDHLGADESFGVELEITGRDFGLAVKRAPAFGKDVGVAVLWSET